MSSLLVKIANTSMSSSGRMMVSRLADPIKYVVLRVSHSTMEMPPQAPHCLALSTF